MPTFTDDFRKAGAFRHIFYGLAFDFRPVDQFARFLRYETQQAFHIHAVCGRVGMIERDQVFRIVERHGGANAVAPEMIDQLVARDRMSQAVKGRSIS